jgi:predicted enzyme related to lactoylglutathione lyase
MLGNIGAVIFCAADPGELANWYAVKFLGTKPAEADGDHYGLMHGNHYLGFEKMNPSPPTGAMQLYFETDDVDADFATIKARGADVVQDPDTMDWGGRAACFKDPAGNRVWIFKMMEHSG